MLQNFKQALTFWKKESQDLEEQNLIQELGTNLNKEILLYWSILPKLYTDKQHFIRPRSEKEKIPIQNFSFTTGKQGISQQVFNSLY